MHGGLWMDSYADLRWGHVEETTGFNDFEALVEHGGGVDGDAAAHDPGGVLESLLRRDGGELFEGRVAEGAAGCGEPDELDFVVPADAHALMHGVVLAVDWDDWNVAIAGGGSEDFAGSDHALLVGEADWLVGEDGRVRGFKAGDSDYGGDDEVGFGMRGAGDGAFGAVDDFDAGDARGFEAGCKVGGQFFSADRDH